VKNYIALLIIMIASLLMAYYPLHGITPILRVLMQCLIIIVVYNLVEKKDVYRFLEVYFWIAAAHSLYNAANFIAMGGHTRSFGFAVTYYDDLTMLIIPLGLSYFLWQKSSLKSVIYLVGTLILLFGMVSTQSRGPLLSVMWVFAFIIIMSYFQSKRNNSHYVRRRIQFIMISFILLSAVLLMATSILDDIAARFVELENPAIGTIRLRMTLWETAIRTFAQNPILGIGPGNYLDASSILPSIKFDPARYYLSTESAHNLLLHYLSETGIVGASALLLLFFVPLKQVYRSVKKKLDNMELGIDYGLLGAALIIFGTIFYLDGWMWGQNAYAAPFMIALILKKTAT